MPQSPQPGERADLALAALLAPSAQKRRLLWIGDPRSGAPTRLATAATSVRVLDTTGRRRRQRGGAIQVTAYRRGPLGFTAGSFDLVVVPDLGVLDDVSSRLDDLAAIVDDGLVVVGVPAIDERVRALRDLLGERFRRVGMLGGSGFRAFALAELGLREAADVMLDGTLLTGRTNVERVFALAGESIPALEPFTLIQLPPGLDEESVASAPDESEALREALERAEVRLDQVQRRLVTTEGELAEARANLRELEDEHDEDDSDSGEELDSSDSLEVDEDDETGEHDLDEVEAPETPGAAETPEVTIPVEPEHVSLLAREDAELPRREVEVLESKLAEAGHRIVELRGELTHRELVLRDVVEELREHQLLRRGPSTELALDVEAEKVAAEFEGDTIEVETAALRKERDELAAQVDVLAAQSARFDGERRGLRSRLAEIEELAETKSARAALFEADLAVQAETTRELEAELGETREALELAMLKARNAGASGSVDHHEVEELRERVAELDRSERHLSERVGHLSGQLVAARGLLERMEGERDRARAETLRLTAQLGALEVREQGLRLGYELRVAELLDDARGEHVHDDRLVSGRDEAISADLDALEKEVLHLRGEREGMRMRLEDCESARGDDNRACDDIDRFEKELEAARLRATDLSVALASRDALINRLQLDLADEERNAESADQRRRALSEEVERLRAAVVEASTEVDRRETAEAQVQEERATATTLRSALANAESRVILEQKNRESVVAELARTEEQRRELEEQLRDGQSRVAQVDDQSRLLEAEVSGLQARLEASTAARRGTEQLLHDLRTRLEQLGIDLAVPERRRAEITAVGISSPGAEASNGSLEQEVRDKDTLLRSLTAQLEERNDRIRGLERRLAGEVGDSEQEDLERRALELEERAARLHEELENERAARQEAVRRAEGLESTHAEDDVAHLEETLRFQSDELDEARSRGESLSEDLSAVQEVLGSTRRSLEEALAGAELDPELADRLGAVLSVLGRF